MSPILLLHGALGSSHQLDQLKRKLETEGMKVLSLNFSGHGGESFESEFGIHQFTNEGKIFLESNEIENISIFGYSMGGYVATWFALQSPNIVSSVITLGTKFDWTPESAEREIRKMNPEKIEVKIPAFARILEHRHKPNDWKVLMNKTAEMMRELGDQPILVEENLKKIKVPMKIILGDEDDMADLDFSKQVASWIPNTTFIPLEKTPHPIEKVDINLLSKLIIE